jgi:hypothetical protein
MKALDIASLEKMVTVPQQVLLKKAIGFFLECSLGGCSSTHIFMGLTFIYGTVSEHEHLTVEAMVKPCAYGAEQGLATATEISFA